MMSSRVGQLVGVLLAIPLFLAQSQERLDSEIRDTLRKSTVYIQTRHDEQGGSGSGFIIKTVGRVVYIATNNHVISTAHTGATADDTRTRLKVVFDGETEAITADLLAADKEHDLAILRCIKDNPPQAYELFSKRKLEETLPVTVFGYPLGDPSITINTAQLSSFAHNDMGAMVRLKVFGKVDPGNSGGPVVDMDGAVVGVTVEKDRRADNIGYAIPAFELHELLRGRLGNFHVDQEGSDLAFWCRFSAGVLDPFDQLEKVTARVIAKKNLTDDSLKKAVSNNGQVWGLLDKAMEAHELKLGENEVKHEFVLEGVEGDVFYVQFEYERAGEPDSISEPLPIVLGGRDKIGEADRRIPLPVAEIQRLRGAQLGVKGYRVYEWNLGADEVVPSIVWDEQRLYLYLAESKGLIRKIDITKHQQEVSLNLGVPVDWCGFSAEGVMAFSREAEELWILENDTLRARHLHKMQEIDQFAASATSFYAFATAKGGSELRAYDLVDGSVTQTFTAESLGSPSNPSSDSARLAAFEWIAFTSDGAHLLIASGGGLHRFTVKDDQVAYDEAGPVIGEEGGRFQLSDDGRHVSYFKDDSARVFEVAYLSEPAASFSSDSGLRLVEVASSSEGIFVSTEATPLTQFGLDGIQGRTFDEFGDLKGVQVLPYQRVPGVLLFLSETKLYFMQKL